MKLRRSLGWTTFVLAAIAAGCTTDTNNDGMAADSAFSSTWTPGPVSPESRAAASHADFTDPARLSSLVTRVYETTLLRRPDDGGLQFWRGVIAQGGLGDDAGQTGIRAMASGMAGPELLQQVCGRIGDTDKLLDNLYFGLLGRPVEPSGKTFWGPQLNEGCTMKRADKVRQVLDGIMISPEFVQRNLVDPLPPTGGSAPGPLDPDVGDTLLVDARTAAELAMLAYRALLFREPSTLESAEATRLMSSQGYVGIVQAFARVDETPELHAMCARMEPQQTLDHLTFVLFDRVATAAEVAAHVPRLRGCDNASSATHVSAFTTAIKTLVRSKEFYDRHLSQLAIDPVRDLDHDND